MGSVDCLRSLRRAYEDFRDCILLIPEDLYLSLIGRWSPRDIVAHLVGWNRNMIEACNAILRGEAPSYYVDAPNDYKNMNAAFVARYSSQNKTELLNDLATSIEELQQYVGSLDRTELDADHGVVHHRGGPATVTRTIESLTGDYGHHRQQLLEWLRTKGVSQAVQKRKPPMELFKEAIPKLSRVAVLQNPANVSHPPMLKEVKRAARVLAMQLQILESRAPNEFEPAFAATRGSSGALLVLGGTGCSFFTGHG